MHSRIALARVREGVSGACVSAQRARSSPCGTGHVSAALPWNPAWAERHAAFAPLRAVAARFTADAAWPSIARWNDVLADLALASATGAPIRFVRQPPRPRRARVTGPHAIYDVRVHECGEVPSRERSWHDFFHMLCWATYPRAKAALAARQSHAIRASVPVGARRLPNARSRERDALAMLDEGGMIVLARDGDVGVHDAVARGDGDSLADAVVDRRARAVLFGHALFEHVAIAARRPRALTVVVDVGAFRDGVEHEVPRADAGLAEALRRAEFLATKPGGPGIEIVDALFGGPAEMA